jgi:hypothetical protein
VAVLWLPAIVSGQTSSVRTSYRVKQVASGVVYLDGGANDGLSEGMKLRISRLPPGAAQMNRKVIGNVTVMAVAGNSAACELLTVEVPVEVGDTAELSDDDAQVVEIVRKSTSTRKFAQVVSFTEGDPIEDELREYVPKPPLPEVNRLRGRIGFEQGVITDRAAKLLTLEEGLVIRADITRINGSYWNFTGYWRGRVTSEHVATSSETLNDLLNRTYQIGLYYNNPSSRYVIGVGRYLLPWAASLSTLDGGYIARRIRRRFTTGVFAGSTPDPTAWNYDPNRQIAGAFVAYEYGRYDSIHLTSTAGAAVTREHWHPERQFLFFENAIQYTTKVSIYHNLEADRLAKNLVEDGRNDPRIARSLFTIRVQPVKRFSFDFSHNYFRDVPTFDTRLLGTGLLDKFLFQGISAGFRYELRDGATVYGNLGRSRRDNDTAPALNYMGGFILARLPLIPVRTDFRYTKFSGSFGAGSYESITFSRQMGDRLRFDFQGGQQSLRSGLTSQSKATFGNLNVDYLIGPHYILGAGWTLYRGNVQDYDQIFINVGYRF